MAESLQKSLLLRLGLAMTSIITLAFIGMLSSVFIADMTEGYAGAINQAGSLRMQAYRIAAQLTSPQQNNMNNYWRAIDQQVDEFDKRLKSARLVGVLGDKPQLSSAYDRLSYRWRHFIKPIFNHEITAHDNVSASDDAKLREALKQNYLARVDGFVGHIDNMVKLLETDTESNIQRLRLIQVTTLFLTIFVVFLTLYLTHTKVVNPLRDLLFCAQRARSGDFTVRTSHTVDDELGQLGYAFNVMAEDLSKMYADLEARVQEKTADLERTNHSLEMLYHTIQHLRQAPLTDTTFKELLEDVHLFLGIGPGTICLTRDTDKEAFKLSSTRNKQDENEICGILHCGTCLGEGTSHTIELRRASGNKLRVFSTPIKNQEQYYGVMTMEMPDDFILDEWQKRLLEAVAHHIGMAISLSQSVTEDRRLALLEERGVIARELHDSLAQSLSYLKIQVSRLDIALASANCNPAVGSIIEQLKEGISSAYRQLRELLTTFRLTMDGRGLRSALEDTVNEFSGRNEIDISLDNQLDSYLLSANEEIHVLQVVREALSNVVRHSKANHAEVSLTCTEDGKVTVQILDNGIGIEKNADRLHHHGLTIMQERARTLRGTISMSRRPISGTEVILVFTPAIRTLHHTTQASENHD